MAIDDWYQAYEEEFEDRRNVEAVFNAVLGELHATISAFESTRWRKKSDFYTLFLVLAVMKPKLPFASNVRTVVRDSLVTFGTDVGRFLKAPDENGDVSDSVKRYSAAVERAASDLASRRSRRNEVTALLETAIRNAV